MNFDCFVLKYVLLFNSGHLNLVCSKGAIRRTNPRHPEYRRTNKGGGVHPHIVAALFVRPAHCPTNNFISTNGI